MGRTIHTHELPEHADPAELCGAIAIVIDVLRATTVMVEALHAGALGVVPCREVEVARRKAAELGGVLGGERGGIPIRGFDLGNRPSDYVADTVGGRRLVLTTTNGTRALLSCKAAARVFPAALTNLMATVRVVSLSDADIHLICAGTDGHPSEDDLLFAEVFERAVNGVEIPSKQAIVETLRTSRGGQNLIRLGFEADVEFAAQIDLRPHAIEFQVAVGEVRLARSTALP